MSAFHPELRWGRFLPNVAIGPRLSAFARSFIRRGPIPRLDDVIVEDVDLPAYDGSPAVSVRVYRPTSASAPTPALLWTHGGGYVMGSPEQDEPKNIALVRALGITVVAVRYRLAPEHPAPAPVEDAYAGLRWLHRQASSLGVDPTRIAIGGASAGGGLATTLGYVAFDRGEVPVAFQLLVYPMLDDRTATRTDHDTRHVRLWSPGSNAWAWSAYLGHPPGETTASSYSAAARRQDLRGLPPTWIGVGTIDLFHDEDIAFAERLRASGVPCELELVEGAFHGFDFLFPNTGVSRAFFETQVRVLRAALGISR